MADYYIEASAGGGPITGSGTSGSPWTGIDDETLFDHAETNGFGPSDTLHVSNALKFTFANPWTLSSAFSLVTPAVIKAWDNGGSITAETPRGTVTAFEVDGNDAVSNCIAHGNKSGIVIQGGKFHASTAELLIAWQYWNVVDCEFYDGGGTEMVEAASTACSFYNCLFRDDGGSGVDLLKLVGTPRVYKCEFRGASGMAINVLATATTIVGSLIHDTTEAGISIGQYNGAVLGCTLDGNATAGEDGIVSAVDGQAVLNNLITNWTGTSANGIELTGDGCVVGYNAYYNNTANENLTGATIVDLANDQTESSDPYNNRAGDDYTLDTAANSIEAAMGHGDAADIGALQNGAGAGGGGTTVPQGIHSIEQGITA